MDAKSIGNTIAKLRTKSGMTQIALAQRLNISSKTVSKWENGQGYPDITTFPLLSSLFGVSIDYLMMGEKKGIAVAGNLLVDVVKDIESYPQLGMRTYVSDMSLAVGGCVPNVSINLAKIDRSVPLRAFGKVGCDEYGRYLVSRLSENNVNIEGINFSNETPTSFCDIVNISTGEHAIFHKKGACAKLAPDDININALDCSIFHIGRAMQLDVFDTDDHEYGTVMARFLHNVQRKGIKTSISITNDSEENYGKKIPPALKYCNYIILSEKGCCRIFGLNAFDAHGNLVKENVKKAMYDAAACGVRDKVMVKSKKVSFILDVSSGEITEIAAFNIPKEKIKGTVGADDAFCAGCLYGIYNEFNDKQILEFASAATACSLFAANSVDGMKSKLELLDMCEQYEKFMPEELS